jgi:hypothetical protein
MFLSAPRKAKFRGLLFASTYLVAVAIGAAGILMAHHPMLMSDMRRMQRELTDTRFNNYIMEHGYRWLRGDHDHADFWSPPIYFPSWNTAAYSDLLPSVVPIYGAFRACGLPPDTSLQFWMIAISGLNFLRSLHSLHHRLRLGSMAAATGAFLFAFGAPRINQSGCHPSSASTGSGDRGDGSEVTRLLRLRPTPRSLPASLSGSGSRAAPQGCQDEAVYIGRTVRIIPGDPTMTIAPALLVNPAVTRWYHCVTRCVRRAFVAGEGINGRKVQVTTDRGK